ncbi:MAG: excinuclease ABC subunit A [Betaproteobacteria bacterium]
MPEGSDPTRPASDKTIRIRGARQNNLRRIDLDLPTGELVVVTGVSGSGKSSLVFDTLYAEGQRRYVETFSPYARQFLDRMDRPQVDRIEGVPPAIAIDQTNPVRTSRSTVGTMTELNDHLKLLFARAGRLICRGCGQEVARDNPASIFQSLERHCAGDPDARVTLTFPVRVPPNFLESEVRANLEAQGYTRIHGERVATVGGAPIKVLDVVQDRFKWGGIERQRVMEAIESGLRFGTGRIDAHVDSSVERRGSSVEGEDQGTPRPRPDAGRPTLDAERSTLRFSDDLHCADCDIHYAEPNPSTFSFNSPLGACETCRGFGRVIGFDLGLVIPDESKTLREGAVKPWQTKSFEECQRDLQKFAPQFGVPLDTPWKLMQPAHREWVVEGQPKWTGKWQKEWYGIKRYFAWLESKAYKMHIRVLLSRYRSYTECTACGGARLKPDALLWRVGARADADAALASDVALTLGPSPAEAGEGSTTGHGSRPAAEKAASAPQPSPIPADNTGASPQPSPVPGDKAGASPQPSPVPADNTGATPPPSPVPGDKAGASPQPSPASAGEGGARSAPGEGNSPDEGNSPREHSAPGEGPPRYTRYKPVHTHWSADTLRNLPGLSVHDLMLLPIERVRTFFDRIRFTGVLDDATELLLDEVRARLKFLCDVGLGYLTLDRQSRTLSGGEVQRINLTTALGTSLVNTLFVLDEPSIGLHPRDMHRVVEVMHRLRDAGNSLVVVEHDPQVMLAADRIIDMGPGPGERGGTIVFNGTPAAIRQAGTLTGQYLSGRRQVEVTALTPDGYATRNVRPNTPRLLLEGARAHNLKNLSIEFPLNHLVVVTGVSGSGKSTLIQDVLYPALCKAKGKSTEAPGAHDRVLGDDHLADVAMVDQSPIGKTTRSNPASYVGAWDAIRTLFAKAALAVERNYGAGMFSFNAGDGRCPTCGGNGFEHVEMQFLSDVYLRCPDCDGKRFRPEVLEVAVTRRGRQRSVADVLELTVSEALAFFADDREVIRALQPIADVGLEYVKLGQPVPTLSGGEAQRLKIAGFLAAAARSGITDAVAGKLARDGRRGGALLLFDEPTTGLHFDDVARLMRALRTLLAAGHSLIVIEHNLDVIRAADWIIDLGPEGGDAGGEVVAAGTPWQVMEHAASHTGQALREYERLVEGRASSAEGKETVASRWTRDAGRSTRVEEPAGTYLATARRNAIEVKHAREHNLKGIDVEIPRDTFTVITGVSGSGKSTLAFDILFNEGQRRYLESLNAYARSIVQPAGKPDVDAIYGIPPTVAIEQRTSRGGRKSTVATMTEVYHFLRLLYMKLGIQHCPQDGVPVQPQSFEAIAAQLLRDYRGQHIGLLAPLVVNRKGLYTDLAKWANNKGYTQLRVDGQWLPTARWPRLDRFREHTIELPVADLVVGPGNEALLRRGLQQALDFGHGIVTVIAPLDRLWAAATAPHPSPLPVIGERGQKRPLPAVGDQGQRLPLPAVGDQGQRLPLPPQRERAGGEGGGAAESTSARAPAGASWSDLHQRVFSTKRACPVCSRSFPEPDPRLFSYNSKHGWCPGCFGTGLKLAGFDAEQTGEETVWNAWFEGEAQPCEVCAGRRLNPTALAVQWQGRSIAELAAGSVDAARALFASLQLDGREAQIAQDVLAEIRSRLDFLQEVGLGYLALDRAAPTLSGGEAQRIRLAAQLGSNLQGVCYVLDEPTIGLHPRDNRILLNALGKLEGKGNTLVVVEHDEDTIRRAQHLIDIGPGAGVRGGRVVAQGTLADIMAAPDSLTGKYLREPLAHPAQPRRPVDRSTPRLTLRGASLHNLRNAEADVPLGRLSVVTGVSGSGKSTLARDVLLANLQRAVSERNTKKGFGGDWHGCAGIDGWERLDRVLEVDQTPIGKTPRSCPATYVGFWDTIRKLFADTQEARMRGYGANRFSFNTGAGRCHACEGQGLRTIEMNFLPDVKVLCDVCGGRRFNRETLGVHLRGQSAGDVLAMEIDDAVQFFAHSPSIARPLALMQDVGLGYLTLGQPSPTLSGGEAQRIKLVTELVKVRLDEGLTRTGRAYQAPHTLYVLDEPTVGLSMADVDKLLRVLHRLADAGNTVVVIEHNLDVIAAADWVIDLGPEGGTGGGRVVAQCSPQELARGDTHTGVALGELLGRSTPAP